MKRTIFALLGIFAMASCSQKTDDHTAHITGNIKGLKSGTLYIQRIKDTSLVAIDTIKIEGQSNFETDIKLDSPEMLYLFLDRGVSNSLDNNLLFFAEPGNINIETSLDSYLASAKVTGSKNHELYEEYKKVDSKFRDEELDLIQQKFNAIKFKKADEAQKINEKQENNIKRKYLYATNFAINNKDYEVAPYIALSEIYDINVKYLDTIQKSMTTKVSNSLYGKKLTDYISKIKKSESKNQ